MKVRFAPIGAHCTGFSRADILKRTTFPRVRHPKARNEYSSVRDSVWLIPGRDKGT